MSDFEDARGEEDDAVVNLFDEAPRDDRQNRRSNNSSETTPTEVNTAASNRNATSDRRSTRVNLGQQQNGHENPEQIMNGNTYLGSKAIGISDLLNDSLESTEGTHLVATLVRIRQSSEHDDPINITPYKKRGAFGQINKNQSISSPFNRIFFFSCRRSKIGKIFVLFERTVYDTDTHWSKGRQGMTIGSIIVIQEPDPLDRDWMLTSASLA